MHIHKYSICHDRVAGNMNKCKYCNESTKNRVFCNNDCKWAWQAKDKPSREWLHQKYIVEGMGTPEIAKMVNRDPKRVYEWIVEAGIPTRPRGANWSETLIVGSGENNAFYGRRHTKESIERMSRSSSGPAPWLRGPVHHRYGKTGCEALNWKGGVTPDRQALYGSQEWKKAVRGVWIRDDATCQRCGIRQNDNRDLRFDIHHIVAFADSRELRAVLCNLVLLCHPCHLWVHSNKNANNDFIKEVTNEN